MNHPVTQALLAALFTWGLTALGAGVVLFFRRDHKTLLRTLLGFAAGVMIAASFFSLLSPAVDLAQELSMRFPFAVVCFGFLCGALFLWGTDTAVNRARNALCPTDSAPRLNRALMLVLSITLHNIPEGLAVGVAFGAAASHSPDALFGAISVAVGIGLQNFPEGAAVSLPLRHEGASRRRAFFWGQASGMVEPIAAVVGALLVSQMQRILPFALSFAAGAMILVAVHELIPDCRQESDTRPYLSTMGIIVGFAVMMALDIALS